MASPNESREATRERREWSLNRIIVLVLMGGFATLILDVRFEHMDVLHHHWQAWIPIVYSGIMVVLSLLTLAAWGPACRRIYFFAAALGFVVGGLGFYFHNAGHFVESVSTLFTVWVQHMDRPDAAPSLAPFSFAGLGLLGALATATRFQPLQTLERAGETPAHA